MPPASTSNQSEVSTEPTNALMVPSIRAEAHTDDRVYEVSFDATAYFAQASDASWRDIHKCGWGGYFPADCVAEFMVSQNKDLAALFDYNARARKRGFECNVEPNEAMSWLQVHRPVLYEEFNTLDND
jgi:hypothetical protein